MAVNNRRHRKGRRRANGDGSIWKRKDGRYAFAAYVLTTDGIYKRVQGYGRDYEDARTKLHKLLADSDRGIPVASENWTGRGLPGLLVGTRRAGRAATQDRSGYESVIRRHLVPALGWKRLDKLTARDVRTFITNVRQQCQYCRDGTDAAREFPRCCAKTSPECCGTRLSARMVQFIHAVLRNALQTAVREEVIPRNVASLVRVSAPRYTVNRGLDLAQAKRLLKSPGTTGFTRFTSWRSAWGCGAGNYSDCAGKTWTWWRDVWRWSTPCNGSTVGFSWCRPRPRARRGRSPCLTCA